MMYSGYDEFDERPRGLMDALKDRECYWNIEKTGIAIIKLGLLGLSVVFAALVVFGLINLFQLVIT